MARGPTPRTPAERRSDGPMPRGPQAPTSPHPAPRTSGASGRRQSTTRSRRRQTIRPPLAPPARAARARSLRTLDRRILATAAGTLAVAAVVLLAVSSSFSGPSRPVGGSKAGVAAVFGSGISRLMQLGLAKLDISAARNLAPRADSRETRHTPHRRSAPRIRPSAPKANHRQAPQLRSPPPVSIDTSHAAANYDATSHVDTTPSYRSVPSAPPSRPAASPAAVSPTGESGALGPIQSPNG